MRVCKFCNRDESQARFYASGSGAAKAAGACCQPCWVRKAVEWRRNNRGKWLRKSHKRAMFLKFGTTSEEYELLYKDAKCAGCGAVNGQQTSRTDRRLTIDHNHKTGKVRGLLCHQCNLTIGITGDDPRRLRALAEYLEKEFQ